MPQFSSVDQKGLPGYSRMRRNFLCGSAFCLSRGELSIGKSPFMLLFLHEGVDQPFRGGLWQQRDMSSMEELWDST